MRKCTVLWGCEKQINGVLRLRSLIVRQRRRKWSMMRWATKEVKRMLYVYRLWLKQPREEHSFFGIYFFFFCSLKFPSVLSFLSIKRASALFWEISLFFCISWFSYTKIKSHCTFVSLLRSDNVFIYFFLFLYPWFMSEDIESWMIPLRENSGWCC